jgi:hypothetical protein
VTLTNTVTTPAVRPMTDTTPTGNLLESLKSAAKRRDSVPVRLRKGSKNRLAGRSFVNMRFIVTQRKSRGKGYRLPLEWILGSLGGGIWMWCDVFCGKGDMQGMLRYNRTPSQIGTISSHVPKGVTTNDPLVSEFHSSISELFFPLFNLFGKEIEA